MENQTQQINQNEQTEFDEEKIKSIIINKAIEYLKANENTLVLIRIVDNLDDIESTAKRLSRFFVALKKNLYTVDVIFYQKKLYRYNIDDLAVSEVVLLKDYYPYYVKMELPNGVELVKVEFYLNNEKLLEKEAFEETKEYEKNILEIAKSLKEMCNTQKNNDP